MTTDLISRSYAAIDINSYLLLWLLALMLTDCYGYWLLQLLTVKVADC